MLINNGEKLKVYRVLYVPDDTAFMIYAESVEQALEKAIKKNIDELEYSDGVDNMEDYLIDEFTPETNNTGMLTFWDVYTVFPRNCTPYYHMTKKQLDSLVDAYEKNQVVLRKMRNELNNDEVRKTHEQGFNDAMEFIFRTIAYDLNY